MPQMFPMNWWLLSLAPFLMILMNMLFIQFTLTTKKMKMKTIMPKTLMMNWKW